MKKKLIPVLVLILVLAVVLPASAATPAPGGPFSTAFRVQNLDAGPVDCTYTFYDSGGTAKATGSQTGIAPGDSLFVYVPNVTDSSGGALASGSYSGVVGCTGKVAAVANFSDADSGASFNGVSSAASLWNAPGLYNNYFNYFSSVVVQNATANPVDITLDIYSATSTTPVKTMKATGVPGYASTSFEQEGAAEMLKDQTYSGRITAFAAGTTTPANVAPVVTIYGKNAAANQLYSYNPFQSGSTTFYAPVVMKNYFGYNSALVIQNMSTEGKSTTVTVTYSSGQTQSQEVNAGAAWSIFVPSQGPSTLGSGNSAGLFSATITSTGNAQPISVIVNESNNYNRAASYDGFAAGSSTVEVPALEKRYFNYNSSVTCQNLGDAATMTIEYFDSTGSKGTQTTPAAIGKGQTALFYQPNFSGLANGWLGSAKITSASPIACVVNQDMNEGTYATTNMDQLMAYEGVSP